MSYGQPPDDEQQQVLRPLGGWRWQLVLLRVRLRGLWQRVMGKGE